MRRSLATLFLVLPLLSACGTTLPQAPVRADGGNGLAPAPGSAQDLAGSAAGGGAVVGVDPVTGRVVTGSSSGSGSGSSVIGGGTGSGSVAGTGTGTTGGPVAGGVPGAAPTQGGTAAAPGVNPGTGRGVTATTVKIGFPVETGAGAAAQAFGISGAGTVASQDIVKAVVKDVNRRGGILGRTVEPVFHSFDTAEAISDPDRAVAKICADFGQDHPVYAVVFNIPHPALRKCLAGMGSPLVLINNIASTLPVADYRANGGSFLYGVNAITVERQAELFVQSLQARDFYATWNARAGGPGSDPTKLGVIHADNPENNALYGAYAKELAKSGRRFTTTVTYASNVLEASAATQSAVLKFKADGVTHVFGASIPFLQAAEQQGYRPRYAYLPNLGAFGAANAPAVQMRGAMTVGWAPSRDVLAAQDPGPTAGTKRCKDVVTGAGLDTADRGGFAMMLNYCDGIYALVAAQNAGRVFGPAGLRQGFESLGSSFPGALSFAASFGPDRHFGVSAVRDMAYDSGCRCLVYTSRTNRG